MNGRPLSEEEVERAVEKIRRMYDDYIITYLKPFTLKDAFEDRYLLVRKQRIDLTRFIHDELELIKGLVKDEDARSAQREERRGRRKGRHRSVSEYADRLIEQYREQIEKYPDLPFDDRASYEIRKLLGALDLFEKEYWPDLERVLRKLYPSYYSSPRLTLEPRIYNLTSGAGRLPPGVSRYKALLMRLPRTKAELEWEERRLILEGAFLLHHVVETLERVRKDGDLAGLERTENWVHSVIVDFRLQEFKPTNQGV